MGKEEVLSGLLMELRRGTIVLSVLSQLTEYGLPVETNTLYPLLRRLEGQGLLTSEWNTEESKPRKYYCITPEGKEIYEKLKKQWQQTAASMERILSADGKALPGKEDGMTEQL